MYYRPLNHKTYSVEEYVISTIVAVSQKIFLFVLVCVSIVHFQELEKFMAFVKRRPAFDVVVDGLNVANIKRDKSKLSESVRILCTCSVSKLYKLFDCFEVSN